MELTCEAAIKKVDLSAKQKKSQIVRRMKIRLEREFDMFIARALGGDAIKILDTILGGGATKTEIPIDAVVANIDLNVQVEGDLKGLKGENVTIPLAIGKKAIASAAKPGDDVGPTIILEFEFAFSQDAWLWFGRNTGGFATVDIKPAQLKLAKKAS